jgi:hypothetical protein
MIMLCTLQVIVLKVADSGHCIYSPTVDDYI